MVVVAIHNLGLLGVFIHWTGGLDWTGLDWTGVDWTHPKIHKMPAFVSFFESVEVKGHVHI